MNPSILTLIPLIAPIALLLYSLFAITNRSDHKLLILKGEFIGLIGIITSVFSIGIVIQNSVTESLLIGWQGLGFSIRLDALSVIMLTMISILGFVILKFSNNYLDGDERKNIFFGRLAITIASVELLVLSGNLFQILIFWIITSVCLHYLLVFYRHRPQAIAAARKKFVVARLGDISLMGAFALIYVHFGSGNLSTIFSSIESGIELNSILTLATILLVISAMFKSAQFPTHGWLIEVVETPTPVSALLHAGLLNAGPFLMIRLSQLMIESTSASAMLLIIGGFTALFASVVYLTQPSIKVSLGYSSIAHMGFSLMICGLGVYSAAFLHVVAHSFYKAHAFLSSGSVVDGMKIKKIIQSKRRGNPILIILSIAVSLSIFLACCGIWGIQITEEFSLVFIGSIIVMGSSQLLVQTMDSNGSMKAIFQSIILISIVTFSFLFFESTSRSLLNSEIPALDESNEYIQKIALVLLACFALVVMIQIMSPGSKSKNLGYSLGVHLRNGFYVNVLFDRIIGSLKHEKFKWVNLTVKEEVNQALTKPVDQSSRSKDSDILIHN